MFARMKDRNRRRLYFAIAVVGSIFGVVLETAMDSFEEQGLAWVGLFLGVIISGVTASYWYRRKERALDDPDERVREIEWRASRLSHGTLTFGVAALALVLLFPWIDLPIGALLWALLFGSVAAHELSVEYYRRQI